MIWMIDTTGHATLFPDDPDVLDIECPCGVVYVADVDVLMPCPYCDTDPEEDVPI